MSDPKAEVDPTDEILPVDTDTATSIDADQEPAPLENSISDTASTMPSAISNFRPLLVAAALSVLWLGFTLWTQAPIWAGKSINVSELATEIAAFSGPIAVFWLIALAFQRSDPLLERRLATAQTLHKAMSPVEEAERRLGEINKKIRSELANIDAVGDLASDRLGHLEKSFADHSERLFAASREAEERAGSISTALDDQRQQMDELGNHLVSRLEKLEKAVENMTGQVVGAGDRAGAAAQSVETRLEGGIQKLDSAGKTLKAKLENIVGTIHGSADLFEESANDVEIRLQSVTDTLLKGMGGFRRDVEGLEGRSHELSEHMKTQGQVLAELATTAATESAKIERSLKDHVAEVRSKADAALQHTEDVSNNIADKASLMSQHISETFSKADEQAKITSQRFSSNIGEAVEKAEIMLVNVQTSSTETSTKVSQDMRDVEAALTASQQATRSVLDDLRTQFADESAGLVERTTTAAERSLSQLRQMRAHIEGEMETLDAAADDILERMSAKAGDIASEADSLSAKSTEMVAHLSSSEERFASVTVQLRERLDQTRAELKSIEDELSARQDAMVAATQHASNTLATASSDFIARSEALAEASRAGVSAISEQTSDLRTKRAELSEITDAAGDAIMAASDKLLRSGHETRATLADSRREMSEASAELLAQRSAMTSDTEELLLRLRTASTAMTEEVTSFSERSETAAIGLSEAAEALLAKAAEADATMQRSVMDTKAELTAGLDDISGTAEQRVLALKEELENTLARLLEDYEDGALRAQKESAHLVMRLGTEADRINAAADAFLDRAESFDKTIKTTSNNDFSKTSKLLLDNLAEASIDIHKGLVPDVSDKDWKAYLDGDKHLFARRTIKLGDRGARKLISHRFKTDGEFKTATMRFMKAFETMINGASNSENGNGLSVTLISSDMGKLYVLLAQSLKRLN